MGVKCRPIKVALELQVDAIRFENLFESHVGRLSFSFQHIFLQELLLDIIIVKQLLYQWTQNLEEGLWLNYSHIDPHNST